MNCSPPGPSVHRISQARILERVAMSFSRGSSRPRQCSPITLSHHMVAVPSCFPATSSVPPGVCVPAAPPHLRVTLSSCAVQASSSLWNPTPGPISGPSLLLPIPAIVVLSVGIYLLLLGLVLLTRHCLLAQGCCTDCSSPCRKQGASRPQDCCQTCAEACDFPLPSPARYLDACCPQPAEADWAPRCPRCCPLCDCACACQLPDCQSLNCLCFEIKLR
ncbi:uncharaterized LOC112694756 homolog isoform X1 [Oryx dammah]|uniref:uncharaterized LOC112694756 homolog isoform X1 n=1 Tax=Oryx dammah TaxID=59534 RepID=UPI001A9A74C0|nr:uncharaterized LOC112694756 homolog isoform X1 [Oryx dammah]XP_040115540.1 uncharaterized LOC112694756 homolog isoform X1 [Oryx dammah]